MSVGVEALAGVRVVEIGGGVAAGYCGKLFSDLGAEVLKIEPPGGDPARRDGLLMEVGSAVPESAVFAWLNTSKNSIVADIDTPAGQAIISDLIVGCDVLIDARPPGASQSGEFAHARLAAANPHLVIVALSWFGESGPYRDFVATDATCRALAGLVKLIGPVAGPPTMLTDHQAGIVAGLSAFVPAIAGLYSRSGGRRFSVSIHEANVTLAEYQAALGFGSLPRGRQGINKLAPTYPMGIYPCADGTWLGITVVTPVQWRGFCTLFGMEAEAAKPEYLVNLTRLLDADRIEPLFAPRFKERTAEEWVAIGLERRLPFVIVPTMEQLLRQNVHRERKAFVSVNIGDAHFEAPVIPLRLVDTPPRNGGAAPFAGSAQKTRLGRDAAQGRNGELLAKGYAPPLSGLRIVDLSMGWAGPLVTRQLADLGADIIKIESCQYTDWWRGVDFSASAIERRSYETRPAYLIMNRNKRGITIDLTLPDGVALVKRLVKEADAVVENYSRGVLPKLGLDYPALRREKPDIVMLSMPSFGSSGEWADVRAYGSTLEQASGLPTLAGESGQAPTMTHLAYGDPIGGLNGAAALLAALLHRRRSGKGQHIDLSQVECMLPLAAPWLIEQSINGRIAPRMGNRHPVQVPHGCFRCAGDDEWIVIAVSDDQMWLKLCTVLGREDFVKDEGLATALLRRNHEDRIEQAITNWTSVRTPEQAMASLQAAGVAAGLVRSPFELVADPHLTARGFWQKVHREHVGDHWQPSAPFREREQPYSVRWPAPTLGEYNSAVLGQVLGLSGDDLARLEAGGVIGRVAFPASRRQARAAAET
jgi:crotonobetainyl-CoA:carnitine CoA-transferase CaiB-like acyl-CoA transferase